ncbi:Hypothetical_protein [Hexamita inflata]|uniref:Hypothetical_protein n=1 Tax=Hexamita inflata TaxID=28002 RepID=A0AA86TUT6_9EUKA|nr:Hypothetical protein HINF_LOCUS15587 [Hexamita inflata]
MIVCVLFILSDPLCIASNAINYVIRISKPQRESAAYLAYEIKFRGQPAQRKYIATYLPFTQQETEVVEYGDIEYICLTPANNIQNINQVAIMDQFDESFLDAINQPYVLFLNSSRFKCELDNGQELYFSQNTINAPLIIYNLDPNFKIRTINENKCVLYSKINVSSENGVIPIVMNTIVVPVQLENKIYGFEFMGSVVCIGTAINTCTQRILPYQYANENENIYMSRSILIGTDFTLPAVQIDKFDSSDTSLTISTGKCTRFVAPSFRTVEIPPGSGIKYRFSEQSMNGRVASFKGPYMCVSKIWYCPLMLSQIKKIQVQELHANKQKCSNRKQIGIIQKQMQELNFTIQCSTKPSPKFGLTAYICSIYIVFIILFGILVAIDQYDEIASMVNDPRNWEIQKAIDKLFKKINWKKFCTFKKQNINNSKVRTAIKSKNGTDSSIFIEDSPNNPGNQSIFMKPLSSEKKSPRKENQSKLDIAVDVPIDEKSHVWKTSKAKDKISEMI